MGNVTAVFNIVKNYDLSQAKDSDQKTKIEGYYSSEIGAETIFIVRLLNACKHFKIFVKKTVDIIKTTIENNDFLQFKNIIDKYKNKEKEYSKNSGSLLHFSRNFQTWHEEKIKKLSPENKVKITILLSGITQSIPKVKFRTQENQEESLSSGTLNFIEQRVFWRHDFKKLEMVEQSLSEKHKLQRAEKLQSPLAVHPLTTTAALINEPTLKTQTWQSWLKKHSYLIGSSMLATIIFGAILYKKYRKR